MAKHPCNELLFLQDFNYDPLYANAISINVKASSNSLILPPSSPIIFPSPPIPMNPHTKPPHSHPPSSPTRLEKSRSQRILWLLEELHLTYDVKTHKRESMLAPASLNKVHPLGKIPILTIETADRPEAKPLVLAESACIVEYLIDHFGPWMAPERYGKGEGKVGTETESWIRYRYYMHYAEGSLMPFLVIWLLMNSASSSLPPPPFLSLPLSSSSPFCPPHPNTSTNSSTPSHLTSTPLLLPLRDQNKHTLLPPPLRHPHRQRRRIELPPPEPPHPVRLSRIPARDVPGRGTVSLRCWVDGGGYHDECAAWYVVYFILYSYAHAHSHSHACFHHRSWMSEAKVRKYRYFVPTLLKSRLLSLLPTSFPFLSLSFALPLPLPPSPPPFPFPSLSPPPFL